MVKKIPCQGIWKFCQNRGKTQGIWFAQVVNSLILKVKEISIFAAKNSQKKFEAGYVFQVSSVYVIVTNHVNWHRENLQSDREKNRENTGNLKKKFEWVPCTLILYTHHCSNSPLRHRDGSGQRLLSLRKNRSQVSPAVRKRRLKGSKK